MHPQRLVVPLFQRPYVWNQENQWEPLWLDVVRMAERVLLQPTGKHYPHFLGAVVLQQVPNPAGTMQERTIIDGQQRLTTLQLLFDALHAELVAAGTTAPAMRLETLIINAEPFRVRSEDQFKVWPTNRDRPAFNAVMSASLPVNYEAVGFGNQRMVQAHRYFAESASDWLREAGEEHVAARAAAIETAVRDLLQLVVIDLGADENAQEIFETLNARGAQLTAADLIKNFIFQRLLEAGADVEAVYVQYWRDFESSFWESEFSVGRTRYSRSSIFLNHWLIAKTGEEVVAREVFTRFKRYVDESQQPMESLLSRLTESAKVYREFVLAGERKSGPMDRVGLFAYRTSVMESEVIKPLILVLLDPDMPAIPEPQLHKVFDTIESWMVRRMLLRASTKSYSQIVADLIRQLRNKDRTTFGDCVEQFFLSQNSNSRYWPDDGETLDQLKVLPAYRRLGRGRLRMVLEAIEDHLRGWAGGKTGLGGERVARAKLAIEHVMPQKWAAHWPLPAGPRSEGEREALIHTLGNLTLLTSRLNTKVSNGPWGDVNGKRQGLEMHDVLVMNRELLKGSENEWTEAMIRSRSEQLAKQIIEVWPTPKGYKSGFATETVRPRHRVDLSDLVSAEFLKPGTKLIPRRKKFRDQEVVVLSDGRIEWNNQFFSSPSLAGKAITGAAAVNGWYFFLVDDDKKRSLKELRIEYLEAISADPEDDD
jgi:GNAT superfamily N-acetyltransferase